MSEASNCGDDTKREMYRDALIARIALESAREAMNKKNGEYRNVLKRAGKAGVSTRALTNALDVRFQDPDVVLVEERERIKMLALSGFLPGIKESLFDRLDIEEATASDDYIMMVDRARDLGTKAGLKGESRDNNPYNPGTQYHVVWIEGYMTGQRAIADEMDPAQHTAADAFGDDVMTHDAAVPV